MRHNRDKVVLVPGGRSSRSEPIPSAQSGEGFAGKGNINCGDLAAPLTAAIRLRASAITGKASAAEALALADQPQVAQSRQAEEALFVSAGAVTFFATPRVSAAAYS